MGQKTAYAHFCNVKRHSIKSNISRCAQLARRCRLAGCRQWLPKAGREHHLLAAWSGPSAPSRDSQAAPVGVGAAGRPHPHRPGQGREQATVCRLRAPRCCQPAPLAPHGCPPEVSRAYAVCRDHPKKQKSGGTRRDSLGSGAESEPHPDAEHTQGLARAPGLALRRQRALKRPRWAHAQDGAGARRLPLSPASGDKLSGSLQSRGKLPVSRLELP